MSHSWRRSLHVLVLLALCVSAWPARADTPAPAAVSANAVNIDHPVVQLSFDGTDLGVVTPAAGGPQVRFGADGKYLRSDAARFGAGVSLTLAGASAASLSQTSFTVAARVKAEGAWGSGVRAVLGAAGAPGFVLGVLDGRVYMNFGGHGASGQTVLLPDQWYDLGWAYNLATGEMALAVNGAIEKLRAGQPALAASGDLLVGGSADGGYFPGLIDDLRVYDHALTGLEFTRLAAANPAAFQPAGVAPAAVSAGGPVLKPMTISLSCAPSFAEQPMYENAIRDWADAVYEMTNGRQTLGRVEIYSSGKRWGNANVWWHCGSHDQWGRSNAVPTGYAFPSQGGRIELFNGQDSDFVYTTQERGYVLAHETGHLAYGLYDEYQEIGRLSAAYPSSPLQSDTPVQNSIMNNQFNASPRTTVCVAWYPWWMFWMWGQCAQVSYRPTFTFNPAWLNLSTPANNTGNTAQQRVYAASAWQTLGRNYWEDPRDGARNNLNSRWWVPNSDLVGYGNTVWTNSTELSSPGSNPAARAGLQIVWMNGTGLGAMDVDAAAFSPTAVVRDYLVETSAVMSGTKLSEIKLALTQAVDAAKDGDVLGLQTFDGTVTERQALVTIDAAARTTLKTIIDGLTASGATVATGEALAAGLTTLTAAGVPTDTVRALYLIGSGRADAGQLPANVQASLVEAGVYVYAVGFGAAAADAAVLTALTAATGGFYTEAKDSNELSSALKSADRYTALTQYTGVRSGYDGALADGATGTYTFTVDAGLRLLDFNVWAGAAPAGVTMSVIKPDTTHVPLTTCDDWSDANGAASACTLQPDASAGEWQIKVENHSGAAIWVYDYVDGYAQAQDVTYIATVKSVSGDTVQYPEPIVITAKVQKNLPMTGVTLRGEVEAPDGSYLEFDLKDDGVAPDAIANDGNYAAYVDYWTDGEYYVIVHADNDALQAKFTNLGVTDQVSTTQTLIGEKFNRYGEAWITVKGWQADDHGDVITNTTNLPTDNTFVHGRIDRAGDVDMFKVDPALLGVSGDLYLRVDNLALGMDPDVYILDKNGAELHNAFFNFDPTGASFLYVPLTMTTPSEVFYVKVQHYDNTAATGTYDISVGPRLERDPKPNTGVGFSNAPAGPYNAYGYPVAPGGVVTFTHTFTNTGTATETFTVTAKSWEGWPLELLVTAPGSQALETSTEVTVTLPAVAPGAHFTYALIATVPATATFGTTANLYLFVDPQGASWLKASTIDKVAVSDPLWARLYLPAVLR